LQLLRFFRNVRLEKVKDKQYHKSLVSYVNQCQLGEALLKVLALINEESESQQLT